MGFDGTSSGIAGTGPVVAPITAVANYAALPAASTVTGKYYFCISSQGTAWLPGSLGGTYYPAGTYYSDGNIWIYGTSPADASQTDVNNGVITDRFVSPSTLNNYSGWNKTKVGLGNVDNTSDANKPVSTAQQAALDLKQNLSLKDATGGYVGLTLFKINFKNALNTFTSFLTNSNTAARTYTFPDKDGTVAMTSDIPVISDRISLINQTADIADTSFSVSGVGLYRISYYILNTTADPTAGSITLNVKYTDNTTARIIASSPLALTTTSGLLQNSIIVRLASGTITYGITHTGIYGTAVYAIYLTSEQII